jgi:hypothetical protein
MVLGVEIWSGAEARGGKNFKFQRALVSGGGSRRGRKIGRARGRVRQFGLRHHIKTGHGSTERGSGSLKAREKRYS